MGRMFEFNPFTAPMTHAFENVPVTFPIAPCFLDAMRDGQPETMLRSYPNPTFKSENNHLS